MASTKRQVIDEVRGRFEEDCAEEIINSYGFLALLFRVQEYCDRTGRDASYVFDALSAYDVNFAAEEADNPAAFLAATIRDL